MCNTKRCNACGENKPLEDFNRDNDRPKGRSDKCRECTRLRKPALPPIVNLTGESKACEDVKRDSVPYVTNLELKITTNI